MRHLNYGHLMYFWRTAREGGVARAAEVLHVTPQTISGQLRTLEESIGEPLFRRSGRRLALTDTGKLVFEYAEEIFGLGAELAQVLRDKGPTTSQTVMIGIADVVPKLVAAKVLEPVLGSDSGSRVVCLEGKLEDLLASMAVQRLDMVLSDRPAPDGLSLRAYSHRLGQCGVSFFADADTAAALEDGFPHSLDGALACLPTSNTALRRSLDAWFEQYEISPNILAECEDSALLKALGQIGGRIFPGPTALEDEIRRQYNVAVIGRTEEIAEVFYAISPERRLKHPAVSAITLSARNDLLN